MSTSPRHFPKFSRGGAAAGAAPPPLRAALAALLAALCACCGGGRAPGATTRVGPEAWREDLRFLARELPRRHANAFHTTSREEFDAEVARLDSDNPLKAKMAARGLYFQSGEGLASRFHTTFDGRTVRRLRPEERSMVIKVLRAGDPAERTLGFVTSLFGRGPYQLLMFEYLSDAPLERQAEAPVADYEGRAAVGGVLCHVVYVEHAADAEGWVRRERWFLGVGDGLPRKLEQLEVDDNGRHGAYVLALSRLRPNVSLGGATFAAPLPKGYARRPHRRPGRPALLSVGDPAPDWRLSDPAGKTHSLSDYRGKVVVLDFWATWCGPCIRAMPGLQGLHERYGDRGAVVFGVNAWEESDAAEFMRRSGYTYGLLLRGEGVAEAYRVGALPTLYVIGVDGRVIHRASGIVDDSLSGLIERHLREHGM